MFWRQENYIGIILVAQIWMMTVKSFTGGSWKNSEAEKLKETSFCTVDRANKKSRPFCGTGGILCFRIFYAISDFQLFSKPSSA